MKVQTVFILLCFLTGVFLSIVHAKPSTELMSKLKSLETFLEKKHGSKGANGPNEKADEQSLTGEEMKNALESILGETEGVRQNEEVHNLGQEEEKQLHRHTENKPDNENNSNDKWGTNTEEGPGGAGEQVPPAGENVIPAEEEVGVPPAKTEEGPAPGETVEEVPHEEEGSPANGEKIEDGNRPGPSVGQVESDKGRDQIFEVLDAATRTIQDALDNLRSISNAFRKLFLTNYSKLKELEGENERAKEKTNEKLGLLDNVVHEINSALGVKEASSTGGTSSADGKQQKGGQPVGGEGERPETNTEKVSSSAGEQVLPEDENLNTAEEEASLPPAKTEEGPAPAEPAEGEHHEDEGSLANGGDGKAEKTEEGNRPGPAAGQTESEKGRDQIFEVSDAATRNIQDALSSLRSLSVDFRKQFQTYDHKLKELEDKDEQTKEKANKKLGLLNNVIHEINDALGWVEVHSSSATSFKDERQQKGGQTVRGEGEKVEGGGEKLEVLPAQENVHPKRIHISDTDLFRTLYSLLSSN